MTRQTVLITGASRGIGATTARVLAAQGRQVVLASRDQSALRALADEINAGPGRALALPCDVTQPTSVQAAVEQCVEQFGRLDVLVNNAGVIDPVAYIGDVDVDAWARVVDINYKGVFYGMRYAIPQMLTQGGGTIINLSSGAATKAIEGWSHYCSTKAAVLSLTQCAHEEYGERGITVVGMSPGTVATDMQATIRASGINRYSRLAPTAHIPPEWAAQAIAFLCTDAAREFAGRDFSLKTTEGRARVGLPPVSD
ncbi:MAG: SDR family oxidoreductase [Abyssibacter sp.]|jgi:NAD(P)-dependent dehydrogenase (short-subunit alcohol dehydrogenase family)|nr:SDR family oxidoreductase [Abyssibacter sp.]MCK5860403.1 SDR family oxidoreductase [Abyssibacter sp.]